VFPFKNRMKLHRILAASVLLNMVLLGSLGYLLGMRSAPPSTAPAPPLVQRTPFSTTPPAIDPAPAAPAPVSPQVASATYRFTPAAPPTNFISTPPLPGTTSRPQTPTQAENPAETTLPAGDTPVQSSAPGNYLHFRGMRVAVAENLGSRGSTQPALGVDVSPAAVGGDGIDPAQASNEIPSSSGDSAAAGPAAAGDRTASASASTPTGSQPRTPGKSTYVTDPSVFSAEDDLFRTKWGWAAFNAARKEADSAAADGSTK
jgi:hypothetical protein